MTRKIALTLFALIILGAPLLFGAVDRVVQVGLVAALGLGLLFAPPALPSGSKPIWWSLAALFLILAAREFLPLAWFGDPQWHRMLTRDFGIGFAGTHHPEPGRALDGLLVIGAGLLWLVWVRTLTRQRENRRIMAWVLFGAAIVVAAVSLAMQGSQEAGIYGIRATAGWTGFGPFPNRNHTASFLAMGTLVGFGCIAQAARRGNYLLALGGAMLAAFVAVALFESKSRGGLVALAFGAVVFAGFLVAKIRDRRVLAVSAAGLFILGALALAFGAQVLFRFAPGTEGEIAGNLRWGIWRDVIAMWKEAPLFGHGLASFPHLFPIYQTLEMSGQVVLHPESSWLLWLVEVGLLPLGIALAVGAVFTSNQVRRAFRSEQGFFLRAGGFAAVAALLVHAAWDVPAHRWGTAAFALAALALACPMSPRQQVVRLRARWAALPIGLAAFWFLPFVTGWPAWSPSTLSGTLALNRTAGAVEFEAFEKLARWFPLSASLHQAIGIRDLVERRHPEAAWKRFRIVNRLMPNSWAQPARQATLSVHYSSGMSLHYWTLAIERAGRRSHEVFRMAFERTRDIPTADPFWARYAETHPKLLLPFAELQSSAGAAYCFALWWEKRASGDDIEDFEVELFHRFLPRHGSRQQLLAWIRRHPEREKSDFRWWATLLDGWEDHERAWRLLAAHLPEPEFPSGNYSGTAEWLQARWISEPGNYTNAQALAADAHRRGEIEKSEQVIVAVANRVDSPLWFSQKAAFIEARAGRYREAVELILRRK